MKIDVGFLVWSRFVAISSAISDHRSFCRCPSHLAEIRTVRDMLEIAQEYTRLPGPAKRAAWN